MATAERPKRRKLAIPLHNEHVEDPKDHLQAEDHLLGLALIGESNETALLVSVVLGTGD
jgi:hypothetical protein